MQRSRSYLTAGSPPLRLNDLHTAAHARSEGLTLVTNNIVGFERVPGLLLQNRVAERLARQSHRQQVQQAG